MNIFFFSYEKRHLYRKVQHNKYKIIIIICGWDNDTQKYKIQERMNEETHSSFGGVLRNVLRPHQNDVYLDAVF